MFLSYAVKAVIAVLIFHALRVILVSLDKILAALEPPGNAAEQPEETGESKN